MPTQYIILPRHAVLRQIRWLECAKDETLCAMVETFLNNTVVALCQSRLDSNSVYQCLHTYNVRLLCCVCTQQLQLQTDDK